MTKIFAFIFSTLLILVASTTAYAAGDSTCEPIYGGGQVCNNNLKFTINKMVATQNKGGSYVENLSPNDPRFAPGSQINFKITVKNTGSRDITNLNVVDKFPQYLTFLSGVGNTNKGASEISFVIGKIEPGKTLEYVIAAKASDSANLPTNQAITCVVNKVTATASDGSTAGDQAQACIEKPTQKPQAQIQEKPRVENIPATGPETGILMALAGTGSLGFFIRKKLS